MAEIPVERKPRSRGPLLALVLLLVLGAIAWILFARRGEPGMPAAPPPDSLVEAPDTTPVSAEPPPAPLDTSGGRVPAPGIVGDDTSGRVPPDTAAPAPEGRLGNP